LLDAVRAQLPSGPRLVAFLAVIYYAALRPEEAVNLGKDNITLPPLVWNAATGKWEEPADDGGELRFCSAAPEVGAEGLTMAPAANNGTSSLDPPGNGAGSPSPRR
jgi:integrase